MTRKAFLALLKKYNDGKASKIEEDFIKRYYALFDAFPDEIDQDKDVDLKKEMLEKILQEIPIAREKKRFKAWQIAASVLFILGAGTFCHLYFRPTISEEPMYRTEEITTNYGEKKTIRMPDGTRVYLNAGSIFRYNGSYNKETRTVELIGEAFFEVVKSETKPFIVHTQQLKTCVLGTSFNIKAFKEDGYSYIALLSGAVKVNDGDHSSFLKPGKKIIYNRANATSSVSEIDKMEHWGDWRKEILAFSGETFSAIAETMEKWYDVKIHFENKRLMKRRFTGEFQNLPINKVLHLLSKGSHFSYRIEKDQVYIK